MSPGPAKTDRSARLHAPYYVWQVPGKTVAIHLYFDVVDRLNHEAMRGLGALPRRGAEVGGVLLGRVDNSAGERLVYVEDCEPVPCEYHFGPSYHLSGKDVEVLQQAVERWMPGPDRRISVVGFYRSHTRKDLFLDESDLAVCSSHFSDPSSVFLVIKPFATRSPSAGFFFWEDGQIHSEAPYSEFAFNRRDLGGGEPRPVRSALRQSVAPDAPAADPYARVSEPEHRFAAPEETALPQFVLPQDPSPLRWLWIAALAVVFAGGGYFGFRAITQWNVSRGSEVVQSALPIALTIRENDRQLGISWSRTAPAILSARRAGLSIVDGSAIRKDIELTGDELRRGSVVYSRITGDVNLKLEVEAEGGRMVSESMRVLKSEEPAATPPGVTQESKPVPPAVDSAAASRQAAPTAAAKVVPPAVTPPEPKPAGAGNPRQAAPATGMWTDARKQPRRLAPPPTGQPVTAARPVETRPPPAPKPAEPAAEEGVVARPERRR